MAQDLALAICEIAQRMNLNEVQEEKMVILHYVCEDEGDHEFYIKYKKINNKKYINCGQYNLLTKRGRNNFVQFLKTYDNCLCYEQTELRHRSGELYLENHETCSLLWNHYDDIAGPVFDGTNADNLLKCLKILLQI